MDDIGEGWRIDNDDLGLGVGKHGCAQTLPSGRYMSAISFRGSFPQKTPDLVNLPQYPLFESKNQ
jgi:hypothetical protein